MSQQIVMLCSLDTKGPEAMFLKECIENLGANPTLIDIGYGQPAKFEADITADDLARAAGSDIDTIRAMQDTDTASGLMIKGGIVHVQKLFHAGQCDGIISFGGISNTALATGIMKTLPFGRPKLVISSAAAIPAYAARNFGPKDITIMHSVVDISGLNDLTRAILRQGAAGICGMAAFRIPRDTRFRGSRMVAVSSFRFAEPCSQAVMRELERRGLNAIPFHAQGVGEDAMEDLVAQGVFEGLVDIVPAGLSEQMFGGNRAARPDRLEAAGRAGIPHVIAPSGFDMISCGPIARRDSGDLLWERRALASRAYTIPDRYRVEARTTAGEVADIARKVALKLNQSHSPACVVVPTLGWSSLSVKGADLYDPEADAAFVPALRAALMRAVPVFEVEAEVNSEQFAHVLVEKLLHLMEAGKASKAAAPAEP